MDEAELAAARLAAAQRERAKAAEHDAAADAKLAVAQQLVADAERQHERAESLHGDAMRGTTHIHVSRPPEARARGWRISAIMGGLATALAVLGWIAGELWEHGPAVMEAVSYVIERDEEITRAAQVNELQDRWHVDHMQDHQEPKARPGEYVPRDRIAEARDE